MVHVSPLLSQTPNLSRFCQLMALLPDHEKTKEMKREPFPTTHLSCTPTSICAVLLPGRARLPHSGLLLKSRDPLTLSLVLEVNSPVIPSLKGYPPAPFFAGLFLSYANVLSLLFILYNNEGGLSWPTLASTSFCPSKCLSP